MSLASPFSIITICLAFSAFFSGMEIAYFAADKLRIELLNQKGSLTGRILSNFLQKKGHFLTTILVGNNLALVIYGIFMATLIEPWLSELLPDFMTEGIVVLILQTIIATALVLIVAEYLPKSLFLLNPDRLITALAIPMAAVYYLMYPIVRLVEGISKGIIVYIFKYEYSEDKPVYGLTDLNNIIKKSNQKSTKNDAEVDARIFNNAIEFKDIKVRECMVHRTEITAVDIEDPIDELQKAFISSGHSKIVIYKENIDDVIGYCHSLEMFKKPKSIKQILTPIIIVPETMPANELLIQFIGERKSLALVVDEFGGTSGIVSMEDVIEEIFGEIRDEHDDEYHIEEQLEANVFVLSARHEVDYLKEKYGWKFPKGDYDTLGGLILTINEDIPRENEVITVGNYLFQILTMEDNRIDRVKLTLLDNDESL